MNVNYNLTAIRANDCLNRTDNNLSVSMGRLSSGYKINKAKDNPSGMAISKKMHAQLRGLKRANQSASDGISVIETAEGALTEIQEMVQRLNELAIQSANGTNSDGDREAIQEEVQQLQAEINRIAENTDFNGTSLLSGGFDLKGYTNNLAIKVETYTDETPIGFYKMGLQIERTFINGEEAYVVSDLSNSYKNDPDYKYPQGIIAYPEDTAVFTDPRVSHDPITDFTVKYVGDDSFSMTMVYDKANLIDQYKALGGSGLQTIEYEVEATGIGAMTLQIGANENQILEVRIPSISTKTLGIRDLDLTTEESATAGIKLVDEALTLVSAARSRLGAYENRLEHTVSSLNITSENMTAAYSRIMDVDMAEEMTDYTTLQVLSQAGTSMLAQANQRPQQVLQLLQ
ncbi:MAG: flagellin FliC3 [Lachnospiraceae bacterium]|nr:flagellin FliC3 [Lachnospiraceae bacterium]